VVVITIQRFNARNIAREIVFINVSALQALGEIVVRVLGLRSRCSLQPRL